MPSDGVWALIGAVVLAFLIRVFNIVAQWLSRILGVDPPEPIPSIKASVDQTGTGAVPSQQTSEAPSSAAPEHPEAPSAPS